MSGYIRSGKRFASVCIALIGLVWSGAASAQFPGGGPPPGGFPGRGGRGNSTLINVPIEALTFGLKLNPTQQKQIGKIQNEVHKAAAKRMSPPGGGAPPDRNAMRAGFEQMQKMNNDATARIQALLTPAQKKAVSTTLKSVQTLNGVGIPAALMGTLKLTPEQNKKLDAVAASGQQAMRAKMETARQGGDFGAVREAMMAQSKQSHDKAMTILNASQKHLVTTYLKAHPQRERGLFGSFGPPPGR